MLELLLEGVAIVASIVALVSVERRRALLWVWGIGSVVTLDTIVRYVQLYWRIVVDDRINRLIFSLLGLELYVWWVRMLEVTVVNMGWLVVLFWSIAYMWSRSSGEGERCGWKEVVVIVGVGVGWLLLVEWLVDWLKPEAACDIGGVWRGVAEIVVGGVWRGMLFAVLAVVVGKGRGMKGWIGLMGVAAVAMLWVVVPDAGERGWKELGGMVEGWVAFCGRRVLELSVIWCVCLIGIVVWDEGTCEGAASKLKKALFVLLLILGLGLMGRCVVATERKVMTINLAGWREIRVNVGWPTW